MRARLPWLLEALDSVTVADFLGSSDIAAPAADPIAAASLRKIIIVSPQERGAKVARSDVLSRTSAEVIVVSEMAAAQRTDAARDADVILFVWAANKHAVYRAFDDVRNRIEYVQGTGPASIVLALERWITRRAAQGENA